MFGWQVKVDRDRTLTVTGKRESSTESGMPSGRQSRERSCGIFYRQFRLPPTVDTSAIKAKVQDGVLAVEIPKLESEVSTVTDINID